MQSIFTTIYPITFLAEDAGRDGIALHLNSLLSLALELLLLLLLIIGVGIISGLILG